MIRLSRGLVPLFLLALVVLAQPAFANNVTISGNVSFSSLDGGPDDADHTVNGVFTVSGDLIVNGTISCNDSGGGSACPMTFQIGGNLIMNPGSALFAENRTGAGNGGTITLDVLGNLLLHGTSVLTPGAVISAHAEPSANSNGGSVVANVGGTVVIEDGAVIDAGSRNAQSGNIHITSGGTALVDGVLVSGPGRALTGGLLDGGGPKEHGGEITVQSTSFTEPAVTIDSDALIVSQGNEGAAGPVTIEGCGIVVKGFVEALGAATTPTRVVLRSGKSIVVDGRDFGVLGATSRRNGHVGADAIAGSAANNFIDLFASGAISVFGPDPNTSLLYTLSGLGAADSGAGAVVRVISLADAVTISGNAIYASETASRSAGGSVEVWAAHDANLDHAVIRATGDFIGRTSGRRGGAINVRSYSGNVIWTNGTGDVRPTGSASGLPTSSQGTISVTACGTIDLSGSAFPTNGPPVGVFPGQLTNACSPAAPSLPVGEPRLPICCNVITILNPTVIDGTAGTAFNQSFTQTGALGTATFSLASGTVPTGLTLATNGTLSGTPTVIGSFPITVKVVDSHGCSGVGTTYPLHIGCPTIGVTSPPLSSAVAGAPFSGTFTESGGVGSTTFSTSSALPAGLTLTPGGVLSGTPTVVGTFPIVVVATDANGCTGSTNYNLTITCQTITVTNPGASNGTVNTAFSQTFTQSGAIGTATFSTASALPTGLALSASGVLSGTPTQTGTFPVVVKVTDSNGCTGTSATYNLTIACQVITVANPTVNSGTVNTAFSQHFTASNTVGTTTFATASALPAGLTLAPNGTLSGTPTQTGSFPIVVTATDANGCSGSGGTYTLTIACQIITVNNPAITSGTAGSPFSASFAATNAVGATTFALASGVLPAGLAFAANGTISGTPTVVGSFPITVQVTDANGCSGTSATYTLAIVCQIISVTAPAASSGVAGSPFSQAFTQSGAIGTATFALAGGVLPSGLALAANGVLSGTPLQTGTFPIVVKVTDSNGCAGTAAYTLTIVCPVITVTNPSVANAVAGTPFSETFTQSGAVGVATFTTSSPLPAGLTLSTSGVLSGTPTVVGSFPIVVTVTDSNGCTGNGGTYNLTIGCPTITVTAPSTNVGVAGSGFSVSFTQSGAVGTATFSLASGSLPSGLSLGSNGTLSGTPLQTGTFPITVTVTDSNGCTGTSGTYTLTIACQAIAVAHPSTMNGTVGSAFSQQYTQSGGIGAVTFTLSAGTLPTGMTLAADGTLSGTPMQSGSFPITVTVTDSNGCSGSDTTTLTIVCQTILVTNPSVTTGMVNTPFSQTFTQSGGIGTITFTESGALPTGLSFAANGLLSGTPMQPGTFHITVTATDSNGCSGSSSYTLVIACQTITVNNPATTTGTAGAPFSQTFTQSGGIGAVTFTTSSALPAGLTLAANGTLNGTPTHTGSFPIVVVATDSNGCTGVSATYTLVIACPTITVTSPATTTGTVDAPFSQAFTQNGAIGTATFSVSSGTLPSGVTLSSAGVLSGTPQVPGTFAITVTVTDSNGCTGTSSTYTLVISCQTITVTNPPAVNAVYSTPLGAGYTFTQTGVGAHTPATFMVASGTLPAGVALSASGALTGTPTQTGLFTITVRVTDANGCSSTGSPYTLTVAPKIVTKAYTAVGNTQLDGGLPSPATPTVLAVALANGDASDVPITYAITAPPANGTLATFNPNGTFLYTPNVGSTTADSFGYTATANGITVSATATISFSGRVWYVDNATSALANDGRSNTPFKTLSAVGFAGTATGDYIYVSVGSGSTTGSYAMLANQQLIGAGATLTVGGVLNVPGASANTPTLSGTLTLASNVVVAGIDMSTGSSAALVGTGVSGLNVTARNVSTTTGVPLNIGGSRNGGTIALTQVNANGAPSAMTVANYNGSLTVLGDGGALSNGSGGSIQNTTGDAVVLTAIAGAGASLNYLNIANSGLNGIRATAITNLTVNRSNISDNVGNSGTDDGIGVTNATGNVSLTNDSITGSPHQGLTLANMNTNLAALTITGTTFSGTTGGDGALVQFMGTSVLTGGTISGSTFANNTSTGLQIVSSDTANVSGLTIQNCTFTSNNAGMDLDLSQAASFTVNVLNNSLNNQNTHAINLFTSSSSTGGVLQAKLQGNLIGTAGVFNSGSFIGDGIRAAVLGGAQGTLTIDGNVIHEIPNARGIDIDAEAFTSGNHVSVEITNNQVVRPTGANGDIGCGPGVPCPLGSIVVVVDQNAGGVESLCSVISGNSAYDPTSWALGAESAYYLARRSLQTFNLEGNTALTPSQNVLGSNTVTDLTTPGVGDFTDESSNVVVVTPGTCGVFP